MARKPIADFCGAAVNSVARWLYGTGSLPVGGKLIKLMYYLDLQGYRVIELERVPKVRRNFGELIGFGVLSIENAAKLLGYTGTSYLYQVLWGNEGISEDKDQKMWDAWKERKEALEETKEKARGLYCLNTISAKVRSRVDAPDRKPLRGSRTAVISIMEGLLVLLEEDPLDELPEARRPFCLHTYWRCRWWRRKSRGASMESPFCSENSFAFGFKKS